jgi:hypothetical protein
MQNQLQLFECTVIEQDLNRVWRQLTVRQKERATLLLAALLVRSAVAAKCDEQPLAEVRGHSHD